MGDGGVMANNDRVCPGTGQIGVGTHPAKNVRCCPVCKRYITITKGGLIRRHHSGWSGFHETTRAEEAVGLMPRGLAAIAQFFEEPR